MLVLSSPYRTPGMLSSLSGSAAISKYIKSISEVNEGSGHSYAQRLEKFYRFFNENYSPMTIDDLVSSKTFTLDVYDLLSAYVSYLRKTSELSPLTLKLHIITVKNLLEYYDIEILPKKFKNRVKLPKAIRKFKEALTKEDIIEIINGCNSIKLKTYVLFLASTGSRASEALSIRLCDINLDNHKVFIRGEYTKTRTDRHVFMTKELARQLQDWIAYKYRERRIGYKDREDGRNLTKHFKPKKNDNDLVFAAGYDISDRKKQPNLYTLYSTITEAFDKTLDRIGKGSKEDASKSRGRRKITLHSFRRHVKSTISDLGYSDYSEWFIGHQGSTYYRKSDKEKYELFQKIEPHLTYMDYSALERQGADITTKLETMEKENIELKKIMQNMKSKTDRIDSSLEKIEKLKKKLGLK